MVIVFPLSVKAPALLLKERPRMFQAESTLGVSRVEPAIRIFAAPLFAGATLPTQLVALLQLLFAPPPSQIVGAGAGVAYGSSATAPMAQVWVTPSVQDMETVFEAYCVLLA